MSDSKQTADQAAFEQDEQQQPQSPQTPGAAAPGAGAVGDDDGGRADERGDGPDASAELKGDLDELVAVAQQRDDYLALAQRTQADFENYRKRVARESALAAERGVAKLAKELLPAIDNLDRALDAAATDDPLLDGVRLVRSERQRRARASSASSPSRRSARPSTRPCTRRRHRRAARRGRRRQRPRRRGLPARLPARRERHPPGTRGRRRVDKRS